MKKAILIALILFLSSTITFASNHYKILSGNAKQGGFVILQVDKNATIKFKDKIINPDSKGRVLIAFSRDDKAEQIFKLTKASGKVIYPRIQIATRQYKEQKINGLPKNKVTPDKKTSKKIWEDIKKARKARNIVLPIPYFNSGFVWPTEGIISGVYGSRRILNGKPKRPHYGVDIAAPRGTPIYSPADGKITLRESMELSGNTVMIDHGYGLRSTMMHLSKFSVKEGDLVKQGDLIGEIGTTGRSTGPHLHWGMSWYKVRLDPALTVSKETKPGDKISF